MEKRDMLKILAILVVVGFITELFFFGGGYRNLFTPSQSAGTNVTGTAVFNGTIRTYEPLLVVPLNTSQAIVDGLRLREGVKNVKSDPSGIVVETETRDDVYPLAAFLRTMNVSSVSVANIAVTEDILVHTSTGDINATPAYGAIRVVTEPLLDTDSVVAVSLIAIVNEGILIDYHSSQIMTEKVAIPMEAAIASPGNNVYTYSIPWESRDSLGNLSSYGAFDYKRVDSIIFTTPLRVDQVLVKKQFPYVTYIDVSSAQVLPSFTDRGEIEANFADVQYELPSSRLVITTNQTPGLPFNATVSYSYVLDISGSQSGYDFGTAPFVLKTDKEYNVGDKVPLNVTAVVIGNKVISYQTA